MRGAAMSLTAAASGLVVFLLSVSVVQGQDGWGVAYSSTEICAVKGSTVEIRCSYTYPSPWRGRVNTVEKTFWFTKKKDGERVDLTTVSEYAGRVEDLCEKNICTLRIRNLTESDSAEYMFRCSKASLCVTNYTWYKEDENSPKASGQIFTITDFRAEHSGSYSCGAQNKLGRSNSTLHLIVVAGSWKQLPFVSIPVVLLAVISLSVFLWIRRKRASRDSSEPEERPDNREECVPDQPEQQDDLQYASVHFSNNRADPLYSNMRAAQPLRHTEQQEVSEYAAVKFSSAAPRARGQDSEEDPAALYSTVNKSR
ncbi:uncharacterized protein LOC117482005 [Trematomus bernacchii]|uniref:uncharacterized protein LOC117482005 n=1 Tax=Trematomus bernacchii TaxID=40690 RepID=UPI00146D5D15|nr:uncharacterized protein LOC117482005 [Trematomus bernacchii]